MMNIYEALKSGQTPDAIAQAFVNELNAAMQQQEADRVAAAEAAKKAADKEKDAQNLADHFNSFINLYYDGEFTINAQEVCDLCESHIAANRVVAKINNKDFDGAMDEFTKALDIFLKENNI